MKTKNSLLLSLPVAVVVAISVMFSHRQTEPPAPAPPPLQLIAPPLAQAAEPASAVPIPAPESQPQVEPTRADIPPAAKVRKSSGSAAQPSQPKRQKDPIQDPDARAALSFVGADPEAEQYWMAAINDPSLPADERKDLIEDLNEDGLSDPKHPGPQDVPLILNRLQLIENLAPNALDQVNAAAFAEAYKDLVNLLAGRPVQ